DLRAITKEPVYFIEHTSAYRALEVFKTTKVHYALVTDEYGVIQGIITLNDILEALVGDASDFYQDEFQLVEREDGTWLVDGHYSLHDFLTHFELDDLINNYDVTTVSGLIITELGYIPKQGEKLQWNSFNFEIIDMDGVKIDKNMVQKVVPEEKHFYTEGRTQITNTTIQRLNKNKMTEGNFVDYVKIYVASGKGGRGSSHLHREKFIEKGGPDGGDGGRGGHVYLVGNQNLWTLFHLKFARHIKAGHGGDGGSSRSTGADGEDKFIEVPLGTVVKDQDTGEVLFEITEDGEKRILAKGGKGGLGNWHFRSSTNQTPRYAQPGLEGEELD